MSSQQLVLWDRSLSGNRGVADRPSEMSIDRRVAHSNGQLSRIQTWSNVWGQD